MGDNVTTRGVGGLLKEDRLAELLSLISGSDSVELKITVKDGHYRSTADALDLDPLSAEIRQVVFFDTPDLDLNKAGLVVRARRIQGGAGDTVIKLRPVVPDELPEDLRTKGAISVEVDAMPGGFVCSASMKGKTTAKEVRRVTRGLNKPGTLFNKAQKGFFKRHAPEGVRFGDLSVLGPINIFKLKFGPPELGRKMVAELWQFPNGSRVLELSTKAAPSEAFRAAAETKVFLQSRGVDTDGVQGTKTKTALDFFAKQLKTEAGQ